MRGYKIFEPEYTCREYRYALNDWNVSDDKIIPCQQGFHFCPQPIDCLSYYKYSPENTYAIVESGEEYIVEDDKVVCNRLKITKPLTYEEFGKLITFDVDTEFKKCSYVNGKLQGEYQEWWDNGQLSKQATYVDGKLHGEYRGWYKDGTLYVHATYINGKIDGEYREWWDNGQLQIKSIYENGINISNKYWQRDGQPIEANLFHFLTIKSS